MAVPRSKEELLRVVNHVFLPPKLPQQDDKESDIALVTITLEALIALRNLLPGSTPEALEKCIVLLTNIRACNGLPDGKVDEQALQKTLETLPVGCTLAAKISSQNAAILVTRHQDELVFEAFELSANDAAVIAAKGRLVRTFPGLARQVPATLRGQADFPTAIANTLTTMCHKKVPGMQPTSQKAGSKHDEHRDTTHPAAVSELFMGILKSIGNPATVSTIAKNTRDEVLWDDAEFPWRRSPMWLLIRVALELVITRSSDGSPTLYKEVMVFIMTHILVSAFKLPADLVYAMTAKIQRRLHKLAGAKHPVLPKFISTSIYDVLQESSESLQKQWNLLQRLDSRDTQLATLATLDLERDTILALPELDKYIQGLRTRGHGTTSVIFVPSSHFRELDPEVLPNLPDPSNGPMHTYYAAANLKELEDWVGRHLEQWVTVTQESAPCEKLHTLISRYHLHAELCYSKNPEARSVMVLTIFEMWVAVDRAAIQICPWLSAYDPGIPADALQNLLLPSIDQMRRLCRVEEYFASRRKGITRPTEHLFTLDHRVSFAMKYFDQSNVHQVLLARIESDARAAREKKKVEFRLVKAEYQRFDALYDSADHQYIPVVVDDWCNPPETRDRHKGDCHKCSYASQRDRLNIRVHEWPLPSEPSQAKAVVFELIVPSWFGFWRDTRLYLLHEVLKGKRDKVHASSSRQKYLLSADDPHLTSQHFKPVDRHRVTLLSRVKPVLNTHYRNKDITTVSEEEICVPNGLRYEYYDRISDAFLVAFNFNDHAVSTLR